MISKYPATTVAVLGVLVFGAVIVLLAAPGLHADPAQVAILIGVLVVAIQQVVSQRTNEANGHRLSAVETVAADTAARQDSHDTVHDAPPSAPVTNAPAAVATTDAPAAPLG